jgi:hypothetical protein
MPKEFTVTTIQSAVVLTGAVLALANSVQAQSTHESQSPTADVTPYVSLGSGASSGVGVAARLPVGSNFSVEVDTGLRRHEMNALNVNVGLLYDLPRMGVVTPYLAGGIGLDQYGWATDVPGYGLLIRSGTAFTVNAGGGLRVPVDENWGLRSDARWFNGVGQTAPERWRLYNGVTFGRQGR